MPVHHVTANGAGGCPFPKTLAIAAKKTLLKAKRTHIIDIEPARWRWHGEHLSGNLDVKIVDPRLVDENFEYLNMDESRFVRRRTLYRDLMEILWGYRWALTPTSKTGVGLQKMETSGKQVKPSERGGRGMRSTEIRRAGGRVSSGSEGARDIRRSPSLR